jgi:DNA-binding transcriptional LysR family regulator
MTVNLKNVDLNLLVIFEAIYATGNISRAAERLGMSQPAVSNALGRLREIIDDPLFVRASRGVEPTVKTREMIHPVREALGLIGRHLGAATSIDLANYKRLFRVVMIDPLEAVIMPKLISILLAQAPGINIECIQAHAKVHDEIRAGTIDIACFPFPVDTTDIVVKPICHADLVVVSRRDHPDIKKPLDRATFEKLPHIALVRELRGLTTVDKSLAASATPRRVVYMASKLWSIAPIVERTDLIGILPRFFVDEVGKNFALDVHEPPTPIPEQDVYLAWHINSEHDPGHLWLRETIMMAMQTGLEVAPGGQAN